MKKTIIVGLGNPIISDDSVGLKIAEKLESYFTDNSSVDVVYNYRGGLSLMEDLINYDEAIIIDAILSGKGNPGSLYKMSLEEAVYTKNIASTHDMDLISAIKFGEMSGYVLPKNIKIWGVEVQDISTFSEELTPDLQKAVPKIVDQIIADFNANTVEYILESKGG